MKLNNLVTRNENGNVVVSMRDLHDWLGVKAQYTDWFKRMLEYGFSENVDFAVIHKNVNNVKRFGGTMKVKDIAMALDMAKEIAMIQRTEKGKEARQYFISIEKAYKQETPKKLSATEQLKLVTQSAVELDDRVTKLEDNMRINGNQEKELLDIHHKSAFRALDGKDSNAYKNRKIRDKTFRAIWQEFKKVFYLPRYGELQQVQFEAGKEFLKEWAPDTELRLEIKKVNGQGNLF